VQLPAGLTWHAVRPLLGVRAFGVSAYSAREPGETVVEPHTESTDGRGHEELYAPDTTVLALGGPPSFEPAGSEWLELARPHLHSDPARARELLERGLEEIPQSAAVSFGFALLAAAQDRRDEAVSALRQAIEREPRLRAELQREPLLAPLAERLD
jgi:tetratricopeptide (TPR) repeat protein